jgi:hypothetical protein
MWPDAKGTSRQSVQDILPEMQKSTFPAKTDLEKGHSPEELAKRATPDTQVRRSAHDSSGQDILVAPARGGRADSAEFLASVDEGLEVKNGPGVVCAWDSSLFTFI